MDIETSRKIKDGIKELEKEIGIQEGFFESLLRSDTDWLFVIRLHAFLEAMCTMLVTKALDRGELIDSISRANIHVKTQYVEKLNLLSKGAVKLIRGLSEIRNIYVHNIKNISLSLDEYLKERKRSERTNFINTFGYDTVEEFTIEKTIIKKEDFILENPRFAIYIGVTDFAKTRLLRTKGA